jgi:hypothetical protein
MPHQSRSFCMHPDGWAVRWVALHLIEELTRHAGDGDIIGENPSTVQRCTS